MNTIANVSLLNSEINPTIDAESEADALVALTIEQLGHVGGGQDIVTSN